MTEVGNYTFSDTSDPSEVLHMTGSDLLATMEMVYGEALDPSIFQPDEVVMEDNSSSYEVNEASSHQETTETNLRSSTVNEDRRARSEPIPQETPTEMKEANTTSILIDQEATSQAEDFIDPSVGIATSKPVDESSVSVDYKASRPKRNARKVSQREEARTSIERPTKKVKSLADLTPEQLEAMMERAQLPEHENLIIGDMKSPEDHQDTKNSPLEVSPDADLVATDAPQQISEPVKNNSEDEISKEVVIQFVDEKTSNPKFLPRGKTTFMTERENDEYICLECKAKDRTPWRFKRPYLIAAHVRKHQFSPHVFLDGDQIRSDNDVEQVQDTTNDALVVADQQSNDPSEVDMLYADANIDLNEQQKEEESGIDSSSVLEYIVEDTNTNQEQQQEVPEVKDSAAEKSSDETDVPPKGKTTRARNANKPNQSIVKAMKETLKVLKKTQRQWANEMHVPEVELSKYFNDYYNPREWTSLEVILKTWLKENAPNHILRRFKTSLSLTRVEDGSTSRNNENDIGLDSYDNTKDRTDHQTTQEVIANSTKIPRLIGIERALDMTSVKQKSTVSNNKAKEPFEYHEVLVLDLLQELNKVKSSTSMNINDCLAVSESAHSVENYLHGVTARTTRAAKYQQATAASM